MNGLLGHVRLRPGQPDALQLHGPRGWLERLALGRRADELPALMASVHTLCAHGHALAARLALQAAQGASGTAGEGERTALALAVARDHLLRIAHDWSRLLPRGGGEPLPLQDCPAWARAGRPHERLAALAPWLHRHWLDRPVPALLAELGADPLGATQRWMRQVDTPLARLLVRELPAALALPTPHRALCAASASQGITMPSRAVPDTGAWSRAHDTAATPAHNAGMRLIARLVDLLRLAAPAGPDWLLAAGHALAEGRGLALVEVGRGLLCYELGVDMAQGQPSVRSLRVTSPSDWNLHPAGVLAEALRTVDDAPSATRLAVAFDPCVPFEIALPEAAHA
ncbi:hypothetical protein [Aquabacterium sp.]|uniref:hypothetical protein n=1 Tax=Aquabacterium sp. TaxID=1872578 RepID=UPI003783D776